MTPTRKVEPSVIVRAIDIYLTTTDTKLREIIARGNFEDISRALEKLPN